MATIHNPMRVLVAVLMCAAMIPGAHHSAYAMRLVNPGAMVRPVVRALANVYGSVTPKWQTAFSNFLNSPTFDAGIMIRELEGTSKTVPIIKAQVLGVAAEEVSRREGLVTEGAGEFFARFENPSEAQLIDAGVRLAAINAFVARNVNEEQRSALGLTEAIETIREQLPEDKQQEFDAAKRIEIDEAMKRTIDALGEFAEATLPQDGPTVLAQGSAGREEMPSSWRLRRAPDSEIQQMIRSLESLVATAKGTAETEQKTVRASFITAAEATRSEVVSTGRSKSTVEEYNAAIAKALFTKFKKEGWQRVNPFAKRAYLLETEKALDLLILEGEDVSYSALAHDLGAGAGFDNLIYFNDIVPLVANRIQLEALMFAMRAGWDSLSHYESILLAIQSNLQLEAFKLGIQADWNNTLYYERVALNVSTEEQLAAIRRGMRSGFTNLNYYFNIVDQPTI